MKFKKQNSLCHPLSTELRWDSDQKPVLKQHSGGCTGGDVLFKVPVR